MMKQLFLFICVFTTVHGFGQGRYTRFIEGKKIQHATLLTDTIHFSSPNLSLLVRERLGKGKIKASLPGENLPLKTIYASADEIRNRIAPNKEIKVIDGEGVTTATIVESTDPLLSARYFDEQTRDVVEVPQVLYIASGKLRSYVPFFSAKYAVSTSWGQKLGISNAFHTGFNTDRELPKSTRKKARPMGNTTTLMRLDTLNGGLMLKQLYGQNLLQALWPFLHRKEFKIYRSDSMSIIPFEKLHQGLVSQVSVPVYDVEGRLTGSNQFRMETLPLLPTAFSKIEFFQQWYYHEKKNLLFTNITELLLYAPKARDASGTMENTAILKIVLK